MKERILWFIYVAIFVLPSALYLLVNFYWWLFDGNVLNVDKMGGALSVVLVLGAIAIGWAVERRVFKS